MNRRAFALGSAAILLAGPVSAQPQPADLVQRGYSSVEPDRIVIHRKPPARW